MKIAPKKLILILSLAGLVLSTYLTYTKLSSSIGLCAFGQCEVIQNSRYSRIFGIPVAAYGVGFYALLFILTAANLKKWAQAWALWGLIFSMYLTILELFVIKALCGWCVLSFVIIILVNLLIPNLVSKNFKGAE